MLQSAPGEVRCSHKEIKRKVTSEGGGREGGGYRTTGAGARSCSFRQVHFNTPTVSTTMPGVVIQACRGCSF